MENRTDQANPEDELLTAYLDGELEEAERADVESRLADDGELRLRLHQLQKTWDVLDQLPRTEVKHSFTQSTLEIVVADARQVSGASRMSWQWPLRILVFLIVPALSMLSSYYFIRYWQDRPNRQLLEDLPVIDNVDVYLKAQTPEFLTELRDSGLFDQNLEILEEGIE